MYAGGALPWELIRAQIYERFGWTPLELAEQPAAEVLRALRLLSLRDDLLRKKAESERKLARPGTARPARRR